MRTHLEEDFKNMCGDKSREVGNSSLERKGGPNMGRFWNGVLVGIGIGLLIAPMRGEEMQRLVRQRYEQLRSNLPEKEQLKQRGQQVAAGLSQTANTLKGAAQQAATRVQGTGSA